MSGIWFLVFFSLKRVANFVDFIIIFYFILMNNFIEILWTCVLYVTLNSCSHGFFSLLLSFCHEGHLVCDIFLNWMLT